VREGCCEASSDRVRRGDFLLPSTHTQGYQKGSVHVPLFMVDDDMSVSGLLKQMSAFGMGGWWLGGQHMKPNDQFMPEVLSKMQPDTKVRVCVWLAVPRVSLASVHSAVSAAPGMYGLEECHGVCVDWT